MINVSVIIPAFNRGYVIADAVQSVLDQTYAHIEEIIVVDDGSTDNTAAVVGSFNDPRIRLIQHPTNKGVAAARNTGLAAARGDLISFLDSDDFWMKDKLALEVAFLADHAEADAVFVDINYFGKQHTAPSVARTCSVFWEFVGSVAACDGIVVPRRTMYLCMLQEMPIKIQATTFRRKAVNEISKFDETWRSGEDWEFLLRFTRAHSLGYIDRPLLVQRYMPDSTFHRYQKDDARSLIGLFSREKKLVGGEPVAIKALNKIITVYAEWLGNRCREDGESVQSAKAFFGGFRQTGNLWFLVKIAAIGVPTGVRPRLKQIFRTRHIHSELPS
jgi:glycosyltransferase involved in cell wall biosynthesis